MTPTEDDRAAVLAANAAFYRAFETLEAARMERVWLRAPHVSCVHPGWGLLAGWGPVMESWERIFANTLGMRFQLDDLRVEIRGDVAWVLLVEELESRHADGTVTATVQATNVFERHDGRWLLVHHHGSPVYPPFDRGEQVH
jgi:ketosteroid isomerase-like protein